MLPNQQWRSPDGTVRKYGASVSVDRLSFNFAPGSVVAIVMDTGDGPQGDAVSSRVDYEAVILFAAAEPPNLPDHFGLGSHEVCEFRKHLAVRLLKSVESGVYDVAS